MRVGPFVITLLLVGTANAEPRPPSFSAELSPGVRLDAWLNTDKTRGFLRVGDTTSQLYRLWKVRLADLDGDGTGEIVLGIWSDEPRHREPQPHRAVWVVSWDPDRRLFVERWRGSALARPLRDFTIVDDQLVATERNDQTCLETTYAWTGFGFRGVSSSSIECPQ